MRLKLAIITLSYLSLTQAGVAFEMGQFSLKSNKKECRPKDLRGPKLGEVRNQGNAGWCFAYSTADLVSYQLNQRVSATDLAINFYQQMPEMPKSALLSSIAGGSDMGAMSYAKRMFCPDSITASDEYSVPKSCLPASGRVDTMDIIRSIEEIHQNAPQDLSLCQMSLISSIFKNLKPEVIKTIVLSKKSTAFEKISSLKDKNCEGSRIQNKMSMKDGLRAHAIDDIDEQLNNNNPISLNYDASFLLHESSGVANHYSVIVGRRLNETTNTCQYLIRNSWGKSCSIYPSPYDKQCEEGNIWVDEDVLGKAILGIKFLK